jgi:hypothetical protein
MPRGVLGFVRCGFGSRRWDRLLRALGELGQLAAERGDFPVQIGDFVAPFRGCFVEQPPCVSAAHECDDGDDRDSEQSSHNQ